MSDLKEWMCNWCHYGCASEAAPFCCGEDMERHYPDNQKCFSCGGKDGICTCEAPLEEPTREEIEDRLRRELVGLAESIRGHDGCECSTREFDCEYHNAIIEKATAIIAAYGSKGGSK
jgi:hypothetical protein